MSFRVTLGGPALYCPLNTFNKSRLHAFRASKNMLGIGKKDAPAIDESELDAAFDVLAKLDCTKPVKYETLDQSWYLEIEEAKSV